jgi:hypothetical protein
MLVQVVPPGGELQASPIAHWAEGAAGPVVPRGLAHTFPCLLNPQVWYLQEGSYRVYRLIPSTGWDIHRSLQMMLHSSFYANRETMITVFYEHGELFQVQGRGL